MTTADERMRVKDPSGARAATRARRRRAGQGARPRPQRRPPGPGGAIGDEPIRIPGRRRVPRARAVREDLLEAMKKKGALAPEGYDDLIKRYYEELIK